MSLSIVRRTPKRFDTSSQSSSSSLLTSTPVTGRLILTKEPAQSPIEQKNSSQTIITPARPHSALVRRSFSSLSQNESNCRYRTRSQSRILEASSILDQSNTPRHNFTENKCSVIIQQVLPSKFEGGKIDSENALSNAKKTGAMFSIFSKPNSTSLLSRSRTEASIQVRGRPRSSITNGGDESSRNTRKTTINNKEKTKNKKKPSYRMRNQSLQEWARLPFIDLVKEYPKEFDHEVIKFFDLLKDALKPKVVATSNLVIPQKKLSPEKINSKIKVLQKRPLESQITIKTQNKTLAKPATNKRVPINKKNTVDLSTQSKESAPPQRNNTDKEIITSQKIAQPVNGKNSTRISGISKKSVEVPIKEKPITQNSNIPSNKSIPEAGHPPLSIADAYSKNNSSADYCHSISTRISDNSCSKPPSFVRRKLYSRTSDYDNNESIKQVDQSFLEKKDKQNLYSLNQKESTSKNIESASEDGEQLEDSAKAADNIRQYCLRKNVDKNFTKFFCDSEKIIDCAIKDANNTKENTCKLVSNILKDMNNAKKDTAKDQINDEAQNKKTETINPEFDDSCFDIFTQKDKDTSKSHTEGKAKSKVSKAKPPKKKIIKPPVKKILEIPKRPSREKPKNESAREKPKIKIVKKPTAPLEKPTTAGRTLRSKNKSIIDIVEKTYSYVLRKSDQTLNCSERDAAESNIQSKNVMKKTRAGSKTHIQKTLEISSTRRRILMPQQQPYLNRKHLEDVRHRRKGIDHNQSLSLGTVNNDSTIVFRNGKLIPGNFGVKKSSSSQSFYNHIDSRERPNIKLNYKTNFKNLYRGFNDFEGFERHVHQPRVTPFFDRTAMNIARETKQHMEYSPYVFKNTSNVLWNPKPSLEYTIGEGSRYREGAFTNPTSSSSFRKQSQQGRRTFDMPTNYGIEKSIPSVKHVRTVPNNHNQLSFCFPEKGNTILKTTAQDLLDKTKALNKMITLPACTEERNIKTSQRTYGRDSQINERLKNPNMMQSASNQLSYHREPLNLNLAKNVSDFGDFDDDPYQILNKQHSTTSSNPMRKYPQPLYGSTFADPFQIPMTRSEYQISHPGGKQNLYKFGENSEYRHLDFPEPRFRNTGLGSPSVDRVPKFHYDKEEIPRERPPRNPFPFSGQTTQGGNYYNSQNHSRNPAVFMKQHPVDYNESNAFKMPMDRPRKRKIVNEEFSETENELKKSRFDDSRLSTASNIGSSTRISSFYSKKEKYSNGKLVTTSAMKSSTSLSLVNKIKDRVMATNEGPMVLNDDHTNLHTDYDDAPMVLNDDHTNLHTDYGDKDDSRSNFSDNDHEDTVISMNNYASIKDKPKESVFNVEKRPDPTTVKETTKVDEAANKKYDICEDEISNIISKRNNDHRNGDDDTFFFKGPYTTPSITSENTDFNSICISKPYSSTLQSSRMENSKTGTGNTTTLNADFTKKYSLAAAGASTSSAQAQDGSSVPVQKNNPFLLHGAFKKSAVTDNRSKPVESPTPDNDDKVSRLANGSPWRFTKANEDDKIGRVPNASPWRFSKW